MPRHKVWQETINITPFVEKIEDAICNLGHESAEDYEVLVYRIGAELVKRYAHARIIGELNTSNNSTEITR